MNSNEPVNVPKDFNMEKEVKYKDCTECGGTGLTIGGNINNLEDCEDCDGEGEVLMTPEDIRDEMEEKKENQNSNEL